MEIFNHNSNIDFLGMRKFSICISILLMIVSIGLIADAASTTASISPAVSRWWSITSNR